MKQGYLDLTSSSSPRTTHLTLALREHKDGVRLALVLRCGATHRLSHRRPVLQVGGVEVAAVHIEVAKIVQAWQWSEECNQQIGACLASSKHASLQGGSLHEHASLQGICLACCKHASPEHKESMAAAPNDCAKLASSATKLKCTWNRLYTHNEIVWAEMQ
eukprot:1161423-Pelagomonas_calceolata.AAC.2